MFRAHKTERCNKKDQFINRQSQNVRNNKRNNQEKDLHLQQEPRKRVLSKPSDSCTLKQEKPIVQERGPSGPRNKPPYKTVQGRRRKATTLNSQKKGYQEVIQPRKRPSSQVKRQEATDTLISNRHPPSAVPSPHGLCCCQPRPASPTESWLGHELLGMLLLVLLPPLLLLLLRVLLSGPLLWLGRRPLWHVASRGLISRVDVTCPVLHATHARELHALLHLTAWLAELWCRRLRRMLRLRCVAAVALLLRVRPHGLARLVAVVRSTLADTACGSRSHGRLVVCM